MARNKKLLLLPGDGIGPEVMGEVRRVIEWFDKRDALSFDIEEGLAGGASYDQHGTPLTDETMALALDPYPRKPGVAVDTGPYLVEIDAEPGGADR